MASAWAASAVAAEGEAEVAVAVLTLMAFVEAVEAERLLTLTIFQ
jgi:hypothetical protein